MSSCPILCQGAATAATAQVTPTLAAHISPGAHSRVSSGVVPGALGWCYLWFLSILGGRCAPPGIRGSARIPKIFPLIVSSIF